jgi:hypothetical protein
MKKDVSPVARLGDVWMPHSAHGSSSKHFLTCFFKPSWVRVEGPLGEIHEPRPGHPSQSYKKVVGHDNLITPCSEDGGGVDLQEFSEVDCPVVPLW